MSTVFHVPQGRGILGAYPKGRICPPHPHHKYGGSDGPRRSATVYFTRKIEYEVTRDGVGRESGFPRESSTSVVVTEFSFNVSGVYCTWATRVAIHYDRRQVHIRKFGVFERRQPEPSTTTGDQASTTKERLPAAGGTDACHCWAAARRAPDTRTMAPACHGAAPMPQPRCAACCRRTPCRDDAAAQLRCAVLRDDEAYWLAAAVAMAVGRSNARQAGSQDLAAVAGSGVSNSVLFFF
eukprot:SAG25_NODE_57_length_18482_cov_39.198063_7_plen_238_part_00